MTFEEGGCGFLVITHRFMILSYVFRKLSPMFMILSYVFRKLSPMFTILSYVFRKLSPMFTILSYVFRKLSYVFLISFYVFSMPNLRVLEADSLQNLQVLDAWLMGCLLVDSVEYLIVRWI